MTKSFSLTLNILFGYLLISFSLARVFVITSMLSILTAPLYFILFLITYFGVVKVINEESSWQWYILGNILFGLMYGFNIVSSDEGGYYVRICHFLGTNNECVPQLGALGLFWVCVFLYLGLLIMFFSYKKTSKK